MAPPTRRPDLARQGLLLVAFDLLVAAVVVRVLGIMVPSPIPVISAIVLGAGGVLAVMAAFVVTSSPDAR
ncbi:MAG: hypothetical protein ACJ739_09620 [Acidimicrobiales bacterium]